MKTKFNLLFVMLFSALCITFSSCSDDDDPVNISLENSDVSVNQGDAVTVNITSGNGDYKVSSANESIATATISGNTITINGIAGGETNITVTDKENKSAAIKVTVADLAEQIAGTYNGTLSMAGQTIATDATITITRSAANTVTLQMNETIMDIPISIECSSDVVLANNVFEIEGTTTFQNLPVNLNGSIDKTGKATINIAIPALTISVVYSGEKQ